MNGCFITTENEMQTTDNANKASHSGTALSITYTKSAQYKCCIQYRLGIISSPLDIFIL